MTTRNWVLVGVFSALALAYVIFFTDWLRPAPIEIASQVRFAIQPPRFGRPPKTTNQVASLGQAAGITAPGATGQPTPAHKAESNGPEVDRVGRPDNGSIDQAPNGVANVTFSLDGWYRITRVRVEDVPADGSVPNVLWQLAGKSVPMNSLLYGREPEGLKPLVNGSTPEPLKPGVPYRLILESGRRRGTNDFRTTALSPID
jgi:hypothetical protein